MSNCPACGENRFNQDKEYLLCEACGWRESDAAQREREPEREWREVVIVSRQVVWDCICGEQNFTDLPADYVVCAKCGERFSQYDIMGDDGTYEQTLDSDGNADFDAFVPDMPDDFGEPEPPEESEES